MEEMKKLVNKSIAVNERRVWWSKVNLAACIIVFLAMGAVVIYQVKLPTASTLKEIQLMQRNLLEDRADVAKARAQVERMISILYVDSIKRAK